MNEDKTNACDDVGLCRRFRFYINSHNEKSKHAAQFDWNFHELSLRYVVTQFAGGLAVMESNSVLIFSPGSHHQKGVHPGTSRAVA